MYDEDDLLPLSALQHLAFCPRQCALIHVEGAWDDNVLTAQGRRFHERAHEVETETRGDLRVCRGVRLRSLRLGLAGQADVVEFHRCPETVGQAARLSCRPDTPVGHASDAEREDAAAPGVPLEGLPGLWRPFPVEYKRGRPKPNHCDEVQVCAQALCLEEMLGASIPAGALYYGKPRRRTPVTFTSELRAEVDRLALRLHELIETGVTPPPEYGKWCKSCSLESLCMPKAASSATSAVRYLEEAISQASEDIP